MRRPILEKIKWIFHKVHKIIVSRLNSKCKIRYLRSLGVKIGENCHLDTIDFSTEPFLITIGNHVAVGVATRFITHDGAIWCFKPNISGGVFFEITVGNNVFIGNRCVILPNTNIGDNCIIGAGSVVRGNIPANSVVAGSPAKVICSIGAMEFFYKNSPGLIQTDGLSPSEKDRLVKQKYCK